MYDWTGVEGDVNLYTNLYPFEQRNKIYINGFCHKGKQIYLVRQSEQNYKQVVNLFLLHAENDGVRKSHFVLIRNLGAFLRNGGGHRKFVCPHCFKMFSQERQQLLHISVWVERERTIEEQNDLPEEKFPDEDERVKFER